MLTAAGNDVAENVCPAPDALVAAPTKFGSPGVGNALCPVFDTFTCWTGFPHVDTPVSASAPVRVHGFVEIPGATDLSAGINTLPPAFRIEFGSGTAPTPAAWGNWTSAVASTAVQMPLSVTGADPYELLLTPTTSTAGTREYVAMRVSSDSGATWTYCDRWIDGVAASGSADGFSAANLGSVLMQAPVVTPAFEGEVLFTEIMRDPSGIDDAVGEWFELHNPTAEAIELLGCTLHDATNAQIIDGSVRIPAGGYLVMGRAMWTHLTGVPAIWRTTFDLANSNSDLVRLTCPDAGNNPVVMDEVLLAPVAESPSGVSFQVSASVLGVGATAASNDTRGAWCRTYPQAAAGFSFGFPFNGALSQQLASPGAANAPCVATTSAGACSFVTPNQTGVPGGRTLSVAALVNAPGLTDPHLTVGNFSYNLAVQYGIAPIADPAAVTWYGAELQQGGGVAGADEYVAELDTPATGGPFQIGAQISLDGGLSWAALPCDAAPTVTLAAGGGNPDPCMILSEYVEGFSSDRGVEITNCGSSPVNLGDYLLCATQNTGTTPCTATGSTAFPPVALPAVELAPGAAYTVCNAIANATFRTSCSLESFSTVLTFNGDDRIQLIRDVNGNDAWNAGTDEVMDSFGDMAIRTNSWANQAFARTTDCTPHLGLATSGSPAEEKFETAIRTLLYGAGAVFSTGDAPAPATFGQAPACAGGGAAPTEASRIISAGDLVITELLPNAGANGFLELSNASGEELNVGGVRIRHGASFFYGQIVLPAGTVLPAGESLIVSGGSTFGLPAAKVVSWAGFWSNFALPAADTLTVTWRGTVIDSVTYDAAFGFAGTTAAQLDLDELAADNNDAANWCAATTATAGILGTPGATNIACPAVVGPGTGPGPGDLIYTELFNNPAQSPEDAFEWFEIFNPTASDIVLDGVRFTDATGGFTIPTGQGYRVPAGEYFVLRRTLAAVPSLAADPTVSYEYGTAMILNNTGELLRIWTDASQTTLVDALDYSAFTGTPNLIGQNGRSAALRSTAYDAAQNDLKANWCNTPAEVVYRYDAAALNYGTPGAANPQCD